MMKLMGDNKNVTAKMGVPREDARWVIGVAVVRPVEVTGSPVREKGCALRSSGGRQEEGVSTEQGFVGGWKEARHTATRRGRGAKPKDSSPKLQG